MKKKIFIMIVLILGIVIIPFPKKVFAEESIRIQTDDGEYHELLSSDIPEGIIYDENTNTLALNNFNGKELSISDLDVTLVLIGENILSNSYHGIYVSNGNQIIKGDGTLTNSGIRVNGSLEINEGTIITESKYEGFEITGDLTINDGNIDITSNDYGIKINGNLLINGGTTTVEVTSNHGIYVEAGIFEVKDGLLNVISDTEYYNGIKLSPSVDNTRLIASGGKIIIDGFDTAIELGSEVNALASFELKGSSIEILNSQAGIKSTDYNWRGYITFDSGSIVYNSSGVEKPSGLLMVVTSSDYDDFISFNSDTLYIDDSKYSIQSYIYYNDKYVFLGEEGFDPDTGEGAAIDVAILSKEKLNIIEGDNQEIIDKAQEIRINAYLSDFRELYINDELVDPDNYVLSEGSTIIQLTDDYINGLADGTYTFRAIFNTGIAEGTFVKGVQNATSDSPTTGDNIMYSILLLILSITALVFRKKIIKEI